MGKKIVMARGGGYFPHNMGRVDHDSCLHEPIALGNLIERVGADRARQCAPSAGMDR